MLGKILFKAGFVPSKSLLNENMYDIRTPNATKQNKNTAAQLPLKT